MRPVRRLVLLAAAAALAACGGGGGNSGQNPFVPPTDDYNALAAWENLLTRPAGWITQGTASDGLAYELRLSVAPVGNASFPLTGTAANRADFGSSLRRGGAILAGGVTELYYTDALLVLGARSSTSVPVVAEACDQATAAALPPAAAKVGASGPLYTTTELSGCLAGAGVIGSTEARWAIEFHAGIVYFCIDATSTDLLTPPNVATEKDCVEISTGGTIGPRARISLTLPGFSITAIN